MSLDDLHKQYGQLMIQNEIIQNRILEVKRAIADEMNKPKVEKKDEPQS
jgi:hypothetical protein